MDNVYQMRLFDLNISVRLCNRLDSIGIKTVGDVLQYQSSGSLYKRIGTKLFYELADELQKYGVIIEG